MKIALVQDTYGIYNSTDQTFSIYMDLLGSQPWEVNYTAGKTSTILLINNFNITYSKQREDPIFPAEITFDS